MFKSIVLAMTVLAAEPAAAEPTVAEILRLSTSADVSVQTGIQAMLGGYVTALGWANGHAIVTSSPQIFCAPNPLGWEDGMKALIQAAEGDPASATEPYGLILIEQLRATYPCA